MNIHRCIIFKQIINTIFNQKLKDIYLVWIKTIHVGGNVYLPVQKKKKNDEILI